MKWVKFRYLLLAANLIMGAGLKALTGDIGPLVKKIRKKTIEEYIEASKKCRNFKDEKEERMQALDHEVAELQRAWFKANTESVDKHTAAVAREKYEAFMQSDKNTEFELLFKERKMLYEKHLEDWEKIKQFNDWMRVKSERSELVLGKSPLSFMIRMSALN